MPLSGLTILPTPLLRKRALPYASAPLSAEAGQRVQGRMSANPGSVQVKSPVALALACIVLLPLWLGLASSGFAAEGGKEPLPAIAKCLGSKGTLVSEEAHENFREWRMWQETLEKMQEGNTLDTAFSDMPKHVAWQWQHVLKQYPTASEIEKLRLISGFFNNWPQAEDIRVYGQDEYWATAKEFMQNSGDCEDFVIVKYQALKLLGWPENALWLVLVKDLSRPGRFHAVLAAKAKDRMFLLDNLSSPGNLVMEHTMYKSIYVPLAAMNATEFWVFPEGEKKAEKQGGK